MTLKRDYSDTNVLNSMASHFATLLLGENYIVYWQARDVVQTLDGSYFQWSTAYATHMADASFLARVTAADGMVTITDSVPASPTWILRPITTAGPIGQDELLLPVISIEVGPAQEVRNMELGSRVKWRYRHLIVDGYTRTKAEQRKFIDMLSDWFEGNTVYQVYNHDAGTLAVVGDGVECTDTSVNFSVDPVAVEPVTYQVICNSRLEYIA